MLTKLRIKNFKCLQDTGDLEIRPLTFLVGPNSSGKSSVLQFLLMLRQTVDSTDISDPLVTSNGWVKMGAYSDFIHRGETHRILETELKSTQLQQEFHFRAAFIYDRGTTRIRLKENEADLGDVHSALVMAKDRKSYLWRRSQEGQLLEENVTPVKFYGVSLPLMGLNKPVDNVVLGLGHIVVKLFQQLFYLGPLREFPHRFYVSSGLSPQDVGIKGERAVDVLWLASRPNGSGASGVLSQTRRWAKRFGMADNIEVRRVSDNSFQLIVTDPAQGIKTNLADIGFGASQTLPIIVQCSIAPHDSTVLIEQPEIHLHPRAQSVLGDLFIDAAKHGNRTFIVETHSEHILNRVCRRVAERKLKKEQVAIYYFKPGKDGTRIQRVTLNDDGQYEKFPKGFFEEDLAEALEHLKAMQLAK